MATTQELEVWTDGDDEPQSVRTDQRDMAAFERLYKVGTVRAMDEQPMVLFRFLGWHALKRTGRTDKAFDDWDTGIVSVEPVDDEVSADPGNPAA